MKTRVKMLKIKVKSLAAETKMIRTEERRTCGRTLYAPDTTPFKVVGRDDVLREELRRHRIDVVRAEQRLSLLAYGFLRGRTRQQVETKTTTEPDWVRVGKLVDKFGTVSPYVADKAKQSDDLKMWASVPSQVEVKPAT